MKSEMKKYLSNPLLWAVTQGWFLSVVELIWIQIFFQTGYLTKAEEHNLPYYLLIAGERKDGFIPFTRTLVLSASFRIWIKEEAANKIWTHILDFESTFFMSIVLTTFTADLSMFQETTNLQSFFISFSLIL